MLETSLKVCLQPEGAHYYLLNLSVLKLRKDNKVLV